MNAIIEKYLDQEVTVHPGILGTRILAGALADLLLRKRGYIKGGQSVINRYQAWGFKNHRPWRPDEIERASKLLADGIKVPVVAKKLGRTKYSVYKKFAA